MLKKANWTVNITRILIIDLHDLYGCLFFFSIQTTQAYLDRDLCFKGIKSDNLNWCKQVFYDHFYGVSHQFKICGSAKNNKNWNLKKVAECWF